VLQLTLDFHTGAFASRWDKVEASGVADHPSMAAKPSETAIHLKVRGRRRRRRSRRGQLLGSRAAAGAGDRSF